jgi:hypothetical protein
MSKTKGRTRLGAALARVKDLQAENALRIEMLATSQALIDGQAAALRRAGGLLRSAADQFEARNAHETSRHLRGEAELLDPARGEGDTLSAGMRQAVEGLAARRPYQEHR